VSTAQEKAEIRSSRLLAKIKWVERRMRAWWSCDISSLKAAVPPDDVSDAMPNAKTTCAHDMLQLYGPVHVL